MEIIITSELKMIYTSIKFIISALLIVLVSEMSKRSTLFGALLASLPLISVMAILWLYIDTKNVTEIAVLSKNIFWLVLPSLVLFITLPVFIKLQWPFYIALFSSCALTAISYFGMLFLLKILGTQT